MSDYLDVLVGVIGADQPEVARIVKAGAARALGLKGTEGELVVMMDELQDGGQVACWGVQSANVRYLMPIAGGQYLQNYVSALCDLLKVVRLVCGEPDLIKSPSYEERRETRPCKAKCGKPFQPGQIYIPNGPYHFGCKP